VVCVCRCMQRMQALTFSHQVPQTSQPRHPMSRCQRRFMQCMCGPMPLRSGQCWWPVGRAWRSPSPSRQRLLGTYAVSAHQHDCATQELCSHKSIFYRLQRCILMQKLQSDSNVFHMNFSNMNFSNSTAACADNRSRSTTFCS
jgi:hypothetical protein